MKMKKTHTPGLWSVETRIGAQTLNRLAISGPRSGAAPTRCIAVIPGEGEYLTPEVEANAALIAAAPELMAALETLTERATNDSGFDQSATHHGIANCDALAKAREAIARATGEELSAE